MRVALLMGVVAGLFSCARDGGSGDGGMDASSSTDARADNSRDGATAAAITTSALAGGSFGTLGVVRLSDHHATPEVDNSIAGDTFVRALGGKVYVGDRDSGVLRVYDPAVGFRNPIAIAMGDATAPASTSDPSDVLLVADNKLYVALYHNDAARAIGVIDLVPGAVPSGVSRWIALPAAKSPLPRANALWSCGGKIYVLLQDLDAQTHATGPSRVAVLDPLHDALDVAQPIIQLTGINPGNFASLDATSCSNVLIADGGDFTQSDLSLNGGGIEQVDLASGRSAGLIIKAATLRGTPYSVTTAGPKLAFTILNMPDWTQKLVAFDPSTRAPLGDVVDTAGLIAFAEVSPTGELYVGISRGDDTTKRPLPGLYALPASASLLAGAPIDLGQAPYAITFF